MFKKFVLLSFLFIALFGAAKQAEAQDPDCYDTYAEDNLVSCEEWSSTQLDTIYLSYPFDSCAIYAHYVYRDCTKDSMPCQGQKSRHVRLLGFDWDCDTLSGYLYPGYPDDFSDIDQARYMEILKEIESALSRLLFLEFYNGLNEYNKPAYQCTMDPGCQMPDPEDEDSCNRFEVFFTNPKCAAICVNENPVTLYFRSTTLPCIEDVQTCCVHKRWFCACVDGGVFIGTHVYEETNTIDGSCNSSYPAGTCPPPPFGWNLHFYGCSNRCPTP